MSRPSYKELWSDEYKDRDEQLQWIRDAVDGNAKFRNSEPPYSEEEELARQVMTMHTRIAELEAENVGLKERVAMLDVTAVFKSLGEMGYIEQTNRLHTRIAELESLVEQLIWVGNDLLVSNTNPVTITLFNGLVCNAKEREK